MIHSRSHSKSLKSFPGIQSRKSRLCTVVKASSAEYNAKVRGDIKRVYWFVSNFSNLPQWYPGVKTSARLDSLPTTTLLPGTKFRVHYSSPLWKMDILYELTELEPGKRCVYLGSNEQHKTREEILFLPDPNDPQMTYVCYKTSFQLRGWLGAAQPVLTGLLTHKAESSLTSLTKLLNSSSSPLPTLPMYEEETKSRSSSSSNPWPSVGLNDVFGKFGDAFKRAASQTTSTSSGTGNDSQKSSGNGNKGSSTAGAPQTEYFAETPLVIPQPGDLLGYYQILGLKPPTSGLFGTSKLTPEEIKLAYRKEAKTWHPDRFVTSEPGEREAASQRFVRLQRAYEVIRIPERRAKYDAGKLEELEQEQAMGV